MTRLQTVRDGRYGIFRITAPDRARLEKHLFRRYPDLEWGTFFRLGFRRTGWGLALSFTDALLPEPGELDRQSPITTFNSDYSLRAFRAVERKEVAMGVIHSHPRGSRTSPSELDDDMDGYFGNEFAAYSGGMPYCSLIFQRDGESGFTFSGRVWDGGEWLPVREMLTVGDSLRREWAEDFAPETSPIIETVDGDESATARLASLFGIRAQKRLAGAVVGVIGCSGTGCELSAGSRMPARGRCEHGSRQQQRMSGRMQAMGRDVQPKSGRVCAGLWKVTADAGAVAAEVWAFAARLWVCASRGLGRAR